MQAPTTHDTNAAIDFLLAWPARPVVVTFIPIDAKGEKGSLDVCSFGEPIDRQAMHEWIESRQGNGNLYFSVNPPAGEMDTKAKRTDVAKLVGLHVDVDPYVGESQADALARLSSLVCGYRIKPTWVLSSGGGVQGFWQLDYPEIIDGKLEIADDLKQYNVQLERDLGGDACHNIDRIMRVPFTINVPDKRKLAKGRKAAVSFVVEHNPSAVYSLATFMKGVKVQSGDGPGAGVKLSGNRSTVDPGDTRLQGVPPWVIKIGLEGVAGDTEGHYGGDRSRAVFGFACECIRIGLSDEILADIFCDTTWRIGDHIRDQQDKERALRRTISRAREKAIDEDLAELNDKFCVVSVEGKTRVLSFALNGLGTQTPTYSTFDDFRNMHLNRTKQSPAPGPNGGTKSEDMGTWWLKNRHRRTYHGGVRFMPEFDAEVVDDTLNLWTGFNCTPKPGDCQLYLDHIKDVICSGNEEHYNYLIRWMAHAVQSRKNPGQIAVCLRGDEGIGKGVFAKVYGHLFGKHYLAVTNPSHLTGNFNAHLESILVLFGDECFYAGNRQHEQILKTMITEPTLMIERKGLNAYQTPNRLHLILATNAEWMVPISATGRRWFVLTVSDKRRLDFEYFEKLMAQMENGGYDALLHFLLTLDLSGFNVRDFPATEAYDHQRALSRRGLDAVVEYLAQQGALPTAHHKQPRIALNCDALKGKGIISWMYENFKDLGFISRTAIRRELTDKWECDCNWRSNGQQGIVFPHLKELRMLFDKRHGKQDWPKHDTWMAPAPMAHEREEGIPF